MVKTIISWEKRFESMNSRIVIIAIAGLLAVSFVFASTSIATSDPSQIYFLLGKYYFNNNDYENAIKYLEKSIELSQDSAKGYYNLGIAYYYNKEYSQAVQNLKKAVGLDPNYAKAHYSLALLYYKNNDLDNAINYLSKTIELEPSNPNANFDIAVAYVDRFRAKESAGVISSDLGDLRKGLQYYNKVLELDSEFAHASSNAKIVQEVLNTYEEAFK